MNLKLIIVVLFLSLLILITPWAECVSVCAIPYVSPEINFFSFPLLFSHIHLEPIFLFPQYQVIKVFAGTMRGREWRRTGMYIIIIIIIIHVNVSIAKLNQRAFSLSRNFFSLRSIFICYTWRSFASPHLPLFEHFILMFPFLSSSSADDASPAKAQKLLRFWSYPSALVNVRERR